MSWLRWKGSGSGVVAWLHYGLLGAVALVTLSCTAGPAETIDVSGSDGPTSVAGSSAAAPDDGAGDDGGADAEETATVEPTSSEASDEAADGVAEAEVGEAAEPTTGAAAEQVATTEPAAGDVAADAGADDPAAEEPTAAAVLADDDAAEPTATAEPVQVETEVVPPPSARPEATPTPELSPEMANFRGSDTAVAISRAIRNRLILQFGCPEANIPADGLPSEPDSFELWATPDVLPYIDAAPEDVVAHLRRFFAALDEADEACNRDQDVWTAATRSALGDLDQVEWAIGTRPQNAVPMQGLTAQGAPEPKADITATTAEMAMMYDRIYAALNKVSDMQSSDLWFSATHFADLRGNRDLAASGAPVPEIVIVGDSVAARGLDSAQLAASVGRPTINYAQFSAYPEGLAEFLPQVIGSGEPETIVWTVYPHQIYTRGCAEQQRLAIDPFRDPITLQALAFAPVEWLNSTPTVDLLFGRYESASAYRGTQLQHKADDLHAPWVARAGSPFVHVGIDEPRIERQIAGSVGRYENPEACEARYASIEATFGSLTSRGHRVIMVIPPTSERLAGLHPDGWGGHDVVVDELRNIASRTGAEVLDVARTVPEDLFHDLVHVNAPGREVFTDEVAAYLAN